MVKRVQPLKTIGSLDPCLMSLYIMSILDSDDKFLWPPICLYDYNYNKEWVEAVLKEPHSFMHPHVKLFHGPNNDSTCWIHQGGC